MTVGDCMFWSTFWRPEPVAVSDRGGIVLNDPLLRCVGYKFPNIPNILWNIGHDHFVFVCMGLLFVNKLPVQYECLTTDYNLRNHMWKCLLIFHSTIISCPNILSTASVLRLFFPNRTRKQKLLDIFPP